MKIDTERVIIEVHLRPVLWDKRNELYKHRDAREAAWRDILKELAPNYENLSEEERKEADSTTETAGEESLCEEMSEQSNLETPNESTQPDTSRQESSHPTSKQKQVKSKKQAPSEFEAQLLECLKSNQLELESEDLAFFQSLQPSLKRFTRYQKLMFRTKVLNIVMEMESQTQPAYYSPIPTTSSSAFTELDSLSPINQDYQTNSIIQDTSSLNDNAISSAAVNDN
ncbi:unnamed protein product [Parnassius apollo]|nr:unnamed protein product [Parnassius apollo]